MEQNVKVMQEKAVLVGLNCDLFTKEEAANERTLDELEALLGNGGRRLRGENFAEPA